MPKCLMTSETQYNFHEIINEIKPNIYLSKSKGQGTIRLHER